MPSALRKLSWEEPTKTTTLQDLTWFGDCRLLGEYIPNLSEGESLRVMALIWGFWECSSDRVAVGKEATQTEEYARKLSDTLVRDQSKNSLRNATEHFS